MITPGDRTKAKLLPTALQYPADCAAMEQVARPAERNLRQGASRLLPEDTEDLDRESFKKKKEAHRSLGTSVSCYLFQLSKMLKESTDVAVGGLTHNTHI